MSGDVEWFTRHAGSPVSINDDDPRMALVNDGPPDWVHLPPDLGGHERRVEGAELGPCAKCSEHECRHLRLSGPELLSVCECPACKFVWYRGGRADR